MTQNQRPDGLTEARAAELLLEYGKNELVPEKKQSFFKKVLHIVTEPMFLLLLIAAVIYFILGEPRDGAIMLIFVVGVISIDVIQEWKTDKTLAALRDLSSPRVDVIRDGRETRIASADLVPGDLMLLHEGVKIPADGVIYQCADFCVDESSLTGEAEGVWKCMTEACPPSVDYWRKDYVYAGTLVTQGTACVQVDQTGARTEYGRIGASVAAAPEAQTPLGAETDRLVKTCAGIAAVLLVLVGVFTFRSIPGLPLKTRLIDSVLAGVTLAMAMIPEEFPVILTVFLSMGAWRLAKKNALVRKLPAVETLGAVTVLCVDKTGTITMNQMTVEEHWALNGDDDALVEIMGMGCETDAYDPMEKAMLQHCEAHGIPKEHLFGGDLITEYAFTNELKMMGHVWYHGEGIHIAAKGSPEKILTVSDLPEDVRDTVNEKIRDMSSRGLRVIAVGLQKPATEAEIPKDITGCRLQLLGLVGLADPPRETVREDIERCTRAGIRVVMITGDNGITAAAIAKRVGIPNADDILTGDELERLSDSELRERVRDVSVFSRVVPAHKMRIVQALQANGEIVAMTGDGVNDAPALKHADIGIAMGKRGSEVSREAADLILMDDNFSTIVDTVRDGRRIYDNIRRAVGYVFVIHIPIALASLLAPFLGIDPGMLMLLPLHVVLLELIIDPTCSIVLERQPAERDVMDRPPRDPKARLLSAGVLVKSLLQGLMLFIGSFGAYYWMLQNGGSAETARTMGLAVLILANLLLVQVNSSSYDPVWRSVGRLARDRVMWFVSGGTLAGLLALLYTPLSGVLRLAPLTAGQLLAAVGIAAGSVLWYELVKLVRRCRARRG